MCYNNNQINQNEKTPPPHHQPKTKTLQYKTKSHYYNACFSSTIKVTSTVQEQLSLQYDTSNKFEVTVDGTGITTFNAIGTSPKFVFADNIDLSTKNIITDTTTGSKLASAPNQKLAFWNATPIVQPANTVAIDALLVNTGLRASGGIANFASNVVPHTSGAYDLGTTALPWGNQFLKSGGKIDFNNGDVTLTHSSNNLAFEGGNFKIGSGTASVPLHISADPANSGTYSQLWLEGNSAITNKGAAFALSSKFLSTTQSWYFGSGDGSGATNNNFRIVDLTAGNLDRFNIDVSGNVKIGSLTTYQNIDSGGDTYWVGSGSGLPYGGAYGNEIAWTQTSAVQNTWYLISDTDMTDMELNLVTHDGSGKLTVTKAGRYMVHFTSSVESSLTNKHVQLGISKNGASPAYPINHFEIITANTQLELSGNAIINCAANDTLEVAIRTTDTGTPDLSVDHLNITLVQVGG